MQPKAAGGQAEALTWMAEYPHTHTHMHTPTHQGHEADFTLP